jgi:hypothetical protein
VEDEELNSINREVRNSTSAQHSVESSEKEEHVPNKKRVWGLKQLLRPDASPGKTKKPDEQKPAAHGAWR